MEELVEIGAEIIVGGLDVAASQKNPKHGCGCLLAFLVIIGLIGGLIYWLS